LIAPDTDTFWTVEGVFADAALKDDRDTLLLQRFSLLSKADDAVIVRLEAEVAAGGGLSLW
jgi:hypothetical protein